MFSVPNRKWIIRVIGVPSFSIRAKLANRNLAQMKHGWERILTDLDFFDRLCGIGLRQLEARKDDILAIEFGVSFSLKLATN